MAAHHKMKRVTEFSTHMQQELIQSTSDDYSIFHIIPRKAFILHHYLKKEEIYMVISNFFDCMFGCGSGHIITFAIYKQLEPFGPIISIPVMGFVTYILGWMGFFYRDDYNLMLCSVMLPYFLSKILGYIQNI